MWDWIKRQFGKPEAPALPQRLSVPRTGTDADVPAMQVGEQGARWLALHEPRPGQRGLPRGEAHSCRKCGAALTPILLTSWGTEAWASMPIAIDGWQCTGCAAMTAPAFLTPEQANALCECGARAGQEGRLEEAEFYFRRVCGSWSDYSIARMQLGSVYLDHRSRELAGEGRQEVLDDYERRALSELLAASGGRPAAHPWVHLKLAHILSSRGEDAAAREHLQRLSAHPDGAAFAEEGAQITDFITRRVRLYQQGVALIAPHMQLHGQPGASSAADEIRRGIDMLRTFSAHNPDEWQSLWFIGKGLQVLGDTDQTLAAFAACWALNPPDTNVGREYCSALLVAGRVEEAVDVMRTTLEKSTEDDAGLMANLALGLLLLGRDDQALRYVRAARSCDPEDAISIALEKLITDVQCAIRPRPIGLRADGSLVWPE